MTDRVRTIAWSDPLLTAKGASGRTGLAFLQAIIDGSVPPAPIQHTLGFDLTEVAEGFARFRGVFGEHMYNPMMGVHGGVTSTLLDSAMGCAVLTLLDEKTGYTTASLTVHLTRPISVKTGAFAAEGRVIHHGSRVVTAEGRLLDGAGKLLSHATASCLLLER